MIDDEENELTVTPSTESEAGEDEAGENAPDTEGAAEAPEESSDELPVVPAAVAEEIAEQDADRTRRMSEDLRLLEALLFASAEPVPERVIAERLGEGADVTGLLEQLRTLYQGRGVELLQGNGRWSFRTAPDLVERLALEKLVPRKLSRAAIETLAIVAYHQPVTRAEIEEIRGVVVSSGTVDILLEEGWLKPRGRKQVPGRPVMWGTSNAFLDHFGLESIEDLPGVDELRASGLLDSSRGGSYGTRGGETLLYDTEESDEALEPLKDGEESEGKPETAAVAAAPEDAPDDAGDEEGEDADEGDEDDFDDDEDEDEDEDDDDDEDDGADAPAKKAD
jgi:segregation and condensation protein B